MRILILGASGGIGESLARALQGEGELVLVGRRIEVLKRLAEELGARAVRADLSQESEVQSLAEEVGAVDWLFHAVGVGGRATVHQVTVSLVEQMLTAHYLTAMWVLKYITLAPKGRAVFFGAYPQYVRVPGFAAYAAAKAALEAFVETARKELQRQGVQLIVVRMPAVATGLWAPLGGPPKNALSPAEAAWRVLQLVRRPEAPNLVEV